MKVYSVKTPTIIQKIFSNYRWCFSSVPKEIYLTFDDGPTPEITSFVLNELKKYNAKATFFCVGENVKKNNTIYKRIIKEGHSVGNHTFSHLNGFRSNKKQYLQNINLASDYIDSKLFRPPYGILKLSQARELQKNGYKIVMWNVLSGDFDSSISDQKCLENMIKKTTNGSIIVMHDSDKSKEKIFYALPKALDHFSKEGFIFKAIS